MRVIKEIIFHCSDTRTDQDFSVETVRKWHTDPKPIGRGWSDIGYHVYIKLDGTRHQGRPIDVIGSHCYGRNTNSIGVCFEGGKNPDGTKWDRPTEAQIEEAVKYVQEIKKELPRITLAGHYYYSDVKTCPNFDVCIIEDLVNN